MTIAITGATSMLGVATIKQCIQKNIPVLAYVWMEYRCIVFCSPSIAEAA